MKRLLFVVAVIASLVSVDVFAQKTIYYSLDIGSDLEMSDPNTPGLIDPGDIEVLATMVKDDATIFGFDPPPPAGVPVGLPYELGIETNCFDLDGEDQLDGFIDVQDGPVQTQAVGGLILNPENILMSFDDDDAPGWYSFMPLYTGDVPVTTAPDHGSDFMEIVSASGWYSWAPNPGIPYSDETLLGLAGDPLPRQNDDDVDALDLETHRYWYWTSDHEATWGTDPADIYGTDTTGAGGTWVAIDNSLIGVPDGTDIDAFEFIVTDDPAILANFGVLPGTYLALLFSVDQDDPITASDESGLLNPKVIYISLLTGAPPMPLGEREEGDIDAITVFGKEENTKWEQLPDLTPNGIDVNATWDANPSNMYLLADDFPCTNWGPITNITIWGSWLHDNYPEGNPSNVSFTLSFHRDVPTNESPMGWSMPREPIWIQDFFPGMFKADLYSQGQEGWMDPPDLYDPLGDSNCWQYTFPVTNNPFVQTGTLENAVVYWLDVQATPMGPERFGWKTTTNHWNDDATWVNEMEGYDGIWNELRYPLGHEMQGQSIDLAFRLEYGDASNAVDYGDAPDTYGTTIASNGASHVTTGPWLGDLANNPDVDADGQPAADAQGDDNDGNDDEDGVWLSTGVPFIRGLTTNYNLTVNGGGGYFQMWVDWNRNGMFDSSESAANTNLADGYHLIAITAPTNAVAGQSYYRCRISSAGGLAPTGAALDGEVEDHSVILDDGYVDWGNLQWPPATTTTIGQATETIYGQVWQSGVTEGPGQGAGITAELGYGPDGSNPEGNSSWTWITATHNSAYTNNNDEYMGTITPLAAGTNDYAYRYSRNGGIDWSYCDRDGNTYDTTNTGHLVILPSASDYDFGDAPSPYPTLLADLGAYHLMGGVVLGSNVDGETNGLPTADADGDDLDGIDDEDGVKFLTEAVRGDTVTVAVITVTPGGYLNTWIDFNGDGDWADAGENIINDATVPNTGTNLALIPVPSDAAVGPVGSRFRYATYTGLGYTGLASDGEVEDYMLTIYQSSAGITTNIVITNIANVVTASTATVWWRAESNVVYQMQLVTNLTTNTAAYWTNVGAQVTGPTDKQSDTNANTVKRFYRVVAPYATP